MPALPLYYTNAPENKRAYSSVHHKEKPGQAHAQSMINSEHAWSLGTVKAGQWMQIDMGEVLTVAGTIVQNRKDYPGQYVKTYTVKTSLDGKNFEAVSGGAYEGKKGTAKNLFHSGGRRKARYVRFTVQTWDAKQHPSMRADVLVVEKKGPSAGISTRAIPATGISNVCDKIL